MLAQDMPAKLWYEAALRPYVHYVPVDANLRNLSDAVRWARQNDAQALAMVHAANRLIVEWTATPAIFRYTQA